MDLSTLIEIFAPEGVWAVLSLVLIFYIIHRQDKRDERHYENMEKREAKQDSREKKYQDSIAKLADGMSDLAEIKELLYKKLVIIPGFFEPPVRILRAAIPENESHAFR